MTLTPEPTTGPTCGKPVGSGVVTFRCSLPAGHEAKPPSDPEPCYAVENSVSVSRWNAWKQRQRSGKTLERQRMTCPECHVEKALVVFAERDQAVCQNCGHVVPFQTEMVSTESKVDPEIMQAARSFDPAQAEPIEEYTPEAPEEEPPHPQPLTHVLADRHGDGEGAMTAEGRQDHLDYWATPPTRTRPGDQRLPDGDESIPDDQELLIRDIEERRLLGISRYGQGHRPFNGRNTLLDLYHERLDEMVYMRSIVRMADASRDDLVKVVTSAFDKYDYDRAEGLDLDNQDLAEIAVDRIMGWVAAQLFAEQPTETADEIAESVEEDLESADGQAEG